MLRHRQRCRPFAFDSSAESPSLLGRSRHRSSSFSFVASHHGGRRRVQCPSIETLVRARFSVFIQRWSLTHTDLERLYGRQNFQRINISSPEYAGAGRMKFEGRTQQARARQSPPFGLTTVIKSESVHSSRRTWNTTTTMPLRLHYAGWLQVDMSNRRLAPRCHHWRLPSQSWHWH